MSDAPLPIEASGLTKRYGAFTAVDGVDFAVRGGECVGILGPNGAGKTTTIRMLCALTPITAGSVRILGMDVSARPRDVKRILGICPQDDDLDPEFPVRKNLLLYARYFDLTGAEIERRVDELLELMQLTEKRDAAIKELSGGMKRRLTLARAMVNAPKILVLDEPTTGLDPQVRQLVWQRVRQFKANGVTVLLTTHYMEEAAQLCDRVILMDHAKILRDGPPGRLVADEVGNEVVELWNAPPEVERFVRTAGWESDEVEGRFYLFDRGADAIAERLSREFPHQDRLIRHATLEDVFLKLSGRRLRE